MPIEVSISTKGLKLTNAQAHNLTVDGALDPDQVLYEFVTQHDDRVRPSHAALHGTVWKVGDPFAPVPPLDYGCRCALRYVAAPSTPAATVLPEATKAPVPRVQAYATHLDEIAPGWKTIIEETKDVPIAEQLGALYNALKRRYPGLRDLRDVAMMLAEVIKARV